MNRPNPSTPTLTARAKDPPPRNGKGNLAALLHALTSAVEHIEGSEDLGQAGERHSVEHLDALSSLFLTARLLVSDYLRQERGGFRCSILLADLKRAMAQAGRP